jgi:hypothetical protein
MVEAKKIGKGLVALNFQRGGGSIHTIEVGQKVEVLEQIDIIRDGTAIVKKGRLVRFFKINANGTAIYEDLDPETSKRLIKDWDKINWKYI